MPDGQQVTIAGLITNVDRRVSKKGNPWAIVTVEDLESSIQCMFFGKVYEAAAPELAVDTVVQIRGQVEKRDETVSMRATEFTVPTLEAQDERPLTIVLPPIALDQSHVRRLGQILTSHPGPCEVKLALMERQRQRQGADVRRPVPRQTRHVAVRRNQDSLRTELASVGLNGLT